MYNFRCRERRPSQSLFECKCETRNQNHKLRWLCFNIFVLVMVHYDQFPIVLDNALENIIVCICLLNCVYLALSYLKVEIAFICEGTEVKENCLIPCIELPVRAGCCRPLPENYWNKLIGGIYQYPIIFGLLNLERPYSRVEALGMVRMLEAARKRCEGHHACEDALLEKCKEKMAKYSVRGFTGVEGPALTEYWQDWEQALHYEWIRWSQTTDKNCGNYVEVSNKLKCLQYQMSCGEESPEPFYSVGLTEFYCRLQRRGIPSSLLFRWTSNLKFWISRTLLNELLQCFDLLNQELQCLECFGMSLKIGVTDLTILENACANLMVRSQVPGLVTALRYLRITPNQRYLLSRIKRLASSPALKHYSWNTKSDPSCPSDAYLIMNIFVTYLDTVLPENQVLFDGWGPFRGYYYVEGNAASMSPVVIVKGSTDPPFYYLRVNGQVEKLPKGRNNMFYALIMFLEYVWRYLDGKLGRISLDHYGLNLLWIIDH